MARRIPGTDGGHVIAAAGLALAMMTSGVLGVICHAPNAHGQQQPPPSMLMLDNHEDLRGARDALVFADLQSFKIHLDALARRRAALVPGDAVATADATAIRRSAAKGAKALTLSDATKSLGEVGALCGDCHARLKRGPEYPPERRPLQAPGIGAHMERHRWSLERMWEGLTDPDGGAWQAGAAGLLEMPLTQEQLPPGSTRDQVIRDAKRLHALGEKALTTRGARNRAASLAAIVEVCGRCHQRVGVRGV
jgi:cytochrome c553